MPDLTEVDISPLEEALRMHLKDWGLIPVCLAAIACGNLAAKGDVELLDRKLALPPGRSIGSNPTELATVQQVITEFHLNSFIDWGGEIS